MKALLGIELLTQDTEEHGMDAYSYSSQETKIARLAGHDADDGSGKGPHSC